jgi:hypothetical protein
MILNPYSFKTVFSLYDTTKVSKVWYYKYIYKNNLTPSQSNAGSAYIYYNNSKQAMEKWVVYSAVLTLV